MTLLNGTPMVADFTMGLDPDGRQHLVVVAKGTFLIPKSDGAACALAPEQRPLVRADTFTGEPGASPPLDENDFAPQKPRCDVLLRGSAHAPGGPAERVRVALRVGAMAKAFDVVGDRIWERRLMGVAPSAPVAFRSLPIGYDRAFGGVDRGDDGAEDMYRQNPVGVGYHPKSPWSAIEGKPVPNTEAPGEAVTSPRQAYAPMAFGAVGRSWLPRLPLAGTFDQRWRDEVFPFLPADFDPGFYQCAPPDQQIAHPQGGEEVVLENLTPDGARRFRLPDLRLPVEVDGVHVRRRVIEAVADTLVLEPDEGTFTVAWRASLPLKKDLFEIRSIVVGEMPRGWYLARARGKTYYPSLAALAESRRRGRA